MVSALLHRLNNIRCKYSIGKSHRAAIRERGALTRHCKHSSANWLGALWLLRPVIHDGVGNCHCSCCDTWKLAMPEALLSKLVDVDADCFLFELLCGGRSFERVAVALGRLAAGDGCASRWLPCLHSRVTSALPRRHLSANRPGLVATFGTIVILIKRRHELTRWLIEFALPFVEIGIFTTNSARSVWLVLWGQLILRLKLLGGIHGLVHHGESGNQGPLTCFYMHLPLTYNVRRPMHMLYLHWCIHSLYLISRIWWRCHALPTRILQLILSPFCSSDLVTLYLWCLIHTYRSISRVAIGWEVTFVVVFGDLGAMGIRSDDSVMFNDHLSLRSLPFRRLEWPLGTYLCHRELDGSLITHAVSLAI